MTKEDECRDETDGSVERKGGYDRESERKPEGRKEGANFLLLSLSCSLYTSPFFPCNESIIDA